MIEREIFVAATPETVFRFLVDPAWMAQWIGKLHRLEPRAGGLFSIQFRHGGVARGAFTEVSPPRRVAFTWGWESDPPAAQLVPPGSSLVVIDLEAKDGGTLVRLRHSGLPQAAAPLHGDRWSVYLGQLEAAARGRPAPENTLA